jgi:2-polyprenyl-6-methoxyphenol hydroxylase-like FAD-dependent oxidoreductase
MNEQKVNIAGGQGANLAIGDAILLTNLIFDLKSTNFEQLVHHFGFYQEKRSKFAKTAYEGSVKFSKVFHNKVNNNNNHCYHHIHNDDIISIM